MKSSRNFKLALIQSFLLIFWVTTGFAAMDLPAKLSEVPVFSGSKIVQVMDMGESSMAALEVKADRDALVKFYKDAMQAKGWKTVFQIEQEDGAVLHFMKDNKTIQISANIGEEGKLSYQMVFIGK
ncbi:MAG: hypothetical protein V2B20_28825 [Pseudomonadota bacterium]